MIERTFVHELAVLDAALEALAAVDPRDLPAEEVGPWAVELQQRYDRLDALRTRAIGAFEAHGLTEGAHGAAPWLAWRCGARKQAMKAALANARALRAMARVDEAFAAGEISSDHVRVLAAAHRVAPSSFVAKEDELLDWARTLRFDTFCRRVAYWRQDVDEAAADGEADRAFEARKLHASETFQGAVVVNATFDAVGGAIWLQEHARLERQLFERDWADARTELGREPSLFELVRTPEQRRLDAARLMAERSAALSDGAAPARPLLQVLVGYETFAGRICELADGTVLTPSQVVPLLTDADVQRVVFDGPSCVLDVGKKQRLFRGATRIAVQLRDLECQAHESCDVRFAAAEVDHIEPHSWGGWTVVRNGRVLCDWHNRHRPAGPLRAA